MSDVTRRERILKALVEEYRTGGHSILPEEGNLYAGIIARVGNLTITVAKINLDTLAAQIDRSLP